jgi:hypothetical protein
MFRKISRYYKLPDDVVVDPSGQTQKSKSVRLLPAVEGRFQHTVEAADRLDHLAFKYYKQPRKWWRVCDGNPAFLSPLDLLGDGGIVTDRFPLAPIDDTMVPPWAALRREVMRLAGVLDLEIHETSELVEELRTLGADEVAVWADAFAWAALVTYNPLNVGIAALAAAMETAGFRPGEPIRNGRVGKTIMIPPDSVR